MKEFCADDCTCTEYGCAAGPADHDDGFGCTTPGCGCIAAWQFGGDW